MKVIQKIESKLSRVRCRYIALFTFGLGFGYGILFFAAVKIYL
jgi:hypothetical protein